MHMWQLWVMIGEYITKHDYRLWSNAELISSAVSSNPSFLVHFWTLSDNRELLIDIKAIVRR